MTEPLTFVCWKWIRPGYRAFLPEYVNILRGMIARHYEPPHRFVCITDDPEGLDGGVEAIPMPVTFGSTANPAGARFPSCYRRLWNFSADAVRVLGPRIVALDIDVIITGDLRPLFDRPENFVAWTDSRESWQHKIAGGLYMLRTGTHTHVWERFDPERSPDEARACGVNGSDQGWMSYTLYPPQGAWTAADGVYSSKWIKPGRPLPHEVRIVSTPGDLKPWSPELQRQHPWIERHWRI